jgi:hypothetical protein
MNEQLEVSDQEDPKLKVKRLILRLNKEFGLTFNRIAKIAGVSYHSIIDWKQGKSRPRKNVENIVQRLERKLEDLEFSKSVTVFSPTKLENLESGKSVTILTRKEVPNLAQDNRVRSPLVIIYFDPKKKTEPYTGDSGIVGAIAEQNGSVGIIAYENDSVQFGEADGLIYLDDASLDPIIKSGWVIAITNIDKTEWDQGYFYYIIGITGNRYLRRLFEEKGEDKEDKKVKLISYDENRFPAILLPLNKIKAIFKVEKIIFKPE